MLRPTTGPRVDAQIRYRAERRERLLLLPSAARVDAQTHYRAEGREGRCLDPGRDIFYVLFFYTIQVDDVCFILPFGTSLKPTFTITNSLFIDFQTKHNYIFLISI